MWTVVGEWGSSSATGSVATGSTAGASATGSTGDFSATVSAGGRVGGGRGRGSPFGPWGVLVDPKALFRTGQQSRVLSEPTCARWRAAAHWDWAGSPAESPGSGQGRRPPRPTPSPSAGERRHWSTIPRPHWSDGSAMSKGSGGTGFRRMTAEPQSTHYPSISEMFSDLDEPGSMLALDTGRQSLAQFLCKFTGTLRRERRCQPPQPRCGCRAGRPCRFPRWRLQPGRARPLSSKQVSASLPRQPAVPT